MWFFWLDNYTKCLHSPEGTIIAFYTDRFVLSVNLVYLPANCPIFAFQRSQIIMHSCVRCWMTSLIIALHFLINVVRWSLRHRSREWEAACPSPPAEAELVTVYWLSNIRCLQGVCSRWSKLAEWLWRTHSVRRSCKVNNNIKPSRSGSTFLVCFFI